MEAELGGKEKEIQDKKKGDEEEEEEKEDRERLRRLRSSELTVKRSDRPANFIERRRRFLGATTIAPEDGATLRPL